MIITIDGPSGTGKTTIAKLLAQRLHFVYFDTGAMYRALTWLLLQKHVALQDEAGIQACLNQFDFQIKENGEAKQYFVGGQDVTAAIRSTEVTRAVSAVSALKQVRSSLLLFQHRFGEKKDVVFEGRDLGTVVFPEAKFKIFLTADPQVRAERRRQELLIKQPQLGRDEVLQDLLRRDEIDSTREVAPLRCPSGAFVVDTTMLSIDAVIEKIVEQYKNLKAN